MMPDVINDFRGDYRWLSNFHECKVLYDGDVYPSTEHAYQAAKAPRTSGLRTQLTAFATPVLKCREAKTLGGTLPLRGDWEQVKYGVMYAVCLDKFTRHVDLAKLLLSTGNAALIEGNHWGDTYWGVCNGVGLNNLGNILTSIRALLWQIKNQT